MSAGVIFDPQRIKLPRVVTANSREWFSGRSILKPLNIYIFEELLFEEIPSDIMSSPIAAQEEGEHRIIRILKCLNKHCPASVLL